MTPDTAAIRAALAAAKEVPKDVDTLLEWCAHHREFRANAPTWLAALVEEVERLRLDCDMAEAGLIRASTVQELVAERDAALAECERLRKSRADLFEHEQEKWHRIAQAQADALDAWRACADQLAAAILTSGSLPHLGGDALAAYERLKEA